MAGNHSRRKNNFEFKAVKLTMENNTTIFPKSSHGIGNFTFIKEKEAMIDYILKREIFKKSVFITKKLKLHGMNKSYPGNLK